MLEHGKCIMYMYVSCQYELLNVQNAWDVGKVADASDKICRTPKKKNVEDSYPWHIVVTKSENVPSNGANI